MIVRVVPLIRLRRDTVWWSYRLPAGYRCLPGSLVEISFQGRTCLGIVWEIIEKDARASKEIRTVLTTTPLVRQPQRAFIEWLSQTGLCSLSTALYVWMPAFLRSFPLPSATIKALKEYEEWGRSAPLSPPVQFAYALPVISENAINYLREQHPQGFASLFNESSKRVEREHWFAIATGRSTVAVGRERIFFAPWLNLGQLTVMEPESIAYYHEQVPYLNLISVAIQLARTLPAQLSFRTRLPTEVGRALWPGKISGIQSSVARTEVIHLGHEPLINPTLLERIKTSLAAGRQVLILYNRHDRTALILRDGLKERYLLPGLESLAKKLAARLGYADLPADILIGPDRLLFNCYPRLGLIVFLTLDHLLDKPVFADQLQAVSDLSAATRFGLPILLQSRQIEHPLIQAFRQNRLTAYALGVVEQQRSLELPPFGQEIVCSLPDQPGANQKVKTVFEQLSRTPLASWRLSHPFQASWRGRLFWHLLCQADSSDTRLPLPARAALVKLPRPWRVQINPWYLT